MQRPDFPERLGAALIAGLEAAWGGPRSQTLERSLARLRRSVGCDAAWWGLVDSGINGSERPRFHLAGSHGLSDDVLDGYAEVFSEDSFAVSVLARPGQAHHWSGSDGEVPPVLQAWVDRHHLAHGLAICNGEPFGDQIFVVVLYRFRGGAPFSQEDATLMRFLFEQLTLIWRRSLQDTFAAASAESLSGVLLARPNGGILFCGGTMAARLDALGWDPRSRTVPAVLLKTLGAGGRVRIGDDWLVVSRDDEGLRAELASAGGAPSLPTRLVQVAALACDGLSAKQIAAELGLTPATVRTYLRDAYGQLGVRNRIELHVAMRRLSRRSPPQQVLDQQSRRRGLDRCPARDDHELPVRPTIGDRHEHQ